ncbi:hypothetical protein ACRALDRAFT_1095243 [Sodiomyces alcalophilus JCM 7366]|uniref:uncharacterized protein n=1 Tax=Sodiomyces alcalophilus JCM 7366 TaxID=591952 RepID=UPI0039B56ABC
MNGAAAFVSATGRQNDCAMNGGGKMDCDKMDWDKTDCDKKDSDKDCDKDCDTKDHSMDGCEMDYCDVSDCSMKEDCTVNGDGKDAPEPSPGRDVSPGIPCVRPATRRFSLDSDSDEDNTIGSAPEVVPSMRAFSDGQESREDEIKSAYSDEPLDSVFSDDSSSCSSSRSSEDQRRLIPAYMDQWEADEAEERGPLTTVEHLEWALPPPLYPDTGPLFFPQLTVRNDTPPPPAPLPAWLAPVSRRMDSSPPSEEEEEKRVSKGKEKERPTFGACSPDEEKANDMRQESHGGWAKDGGWAQNGGFIGRQKKRDMEARRRRSQFSVLQRRRAAMNAEFQERIEQGLEPAQAMKCEGEHARGKEDDENGSEGELAGPHRAGGPVDVNRESHMQTPDQARGDVGDIEAETSPGLQDRMPDLGGGCLRTSRDRSDSWASDRSDRTVVPNEKYGVAPHDLCKVARGQMMKYYGITVTAYCRPPPYVPKWFSPDDVTAKRDKRDSRDWPERLFVVLDYSYTQHRMVFLRTATLPFLVGNAQHGPRSLAETILLDKRKNELWQNCSCQQLIPVGVLDGWGDHQAQTTLPTLYHPDSGFSNYFSRRRPSGIRRKNASALAHCKALSMPTTSFSSSVPARGDGEPGVEARSDHSLAGFVVVENELAVYAVRPLPSRPHNNFPKICSRFIEWDISWTTRAVEKGPAMPRSDSWLEEIGFTHGDLLCGGNEQSNQPLDTTYHFLYREVVGEIGEAAEQTSIIRGSWTGAMLPSYVLRKLRDLGLARDWIRQAQRNPSGRVRTSWLGHAAMIFLSYGALIPSALLTPSPGTAYECTELSSRHNATDADITDALRLFRPSSYNPYNLHCSRSPFYISMFFFGFMFPSSPFPAFVIPPPSASHKDGLSPLPHEFYGFSPCTGSSGMYNAPPPEVGYPFALPLAACFCLAVQNLALTFRGQVACLGAVLCSAEIYKRARCFRVMDLRVSRPELQYSFFLAHESTSRTQSFYTDPNFIPNASRNEQGKPKITKMLQLLPALNPLNYLLLFLAALSAIVIGFSTIRYVRFSSSFMALFLATWSHWHVRRAKFRRRRFHLCLLWRCEEISQRQTFRYVVLYALLPSMPPFSFRFPGYGIKRVAFDMESYTSERIIYQRSMFRFRKARQQMPT